MLEHFLNEKLLTSLAEENSIRINARKILKIIHQLRPLNGKMLQIGCGYGFFLDEAKSYFSNRVGIDLCSNAIISAQKYTPDVYLGNIDS